MYQSALVLSFLDAHTAAPAQAAPLAAPWAPPPSHFATLWSHDALHDDVAGAEYTPRQLKAMRLLYSQVRRGDYEIWGVRRDLKADSELPATLVPVIHTHGYESMRSLFASFAEEEAAEERRQAREQRRARRTRSFLAEQQRQEVVVISQ